MRSQDKAIFLEAARQFQIWILVRRTNRASLEYVGRPGYTPKRIDCKAKTADIDIAPYRLAGLVVDPGIHPKAFKPGKAAKAADCWAAMKPLLGRAGTRNASAAARCWCSSLMPKHHRGMYSSSSGTTSEVKGRSRSSAASAVSPRSMSAVIRTKAPSLRFMRIASFTR
jgi:hypothetical protein